MAKVVSISGGGPGDDAPDDDLAPGKDARGLEYALDALDLEVRLDTRSGRTEWRNRTPGADWTALTDTRAAALRQEIADSCQYRRSDGRRVRLRYGRDSFREALLALLHTRQVDPFREWLETLETPSGDEGLLDTWLPELFSIPDPGPIEVWASRYIFLAPVQRTYDPGCQLDEVPVLVGDQGIGKSSALRALFPPDPPGFQDRFYSGRLRLDADPQKQAEALMGRVVVELSELAGIRDRRRLDDIKTFITLRDDGDIRLAYRENPTPRPRVCAFVGTANPRPQGILPNDPTGNRRWVIVSLQPPAGPVEEFLDRHRDRLWSETLERYRAGERANLPRDLMDAAALASERHRNRDPLEADLDEALASRGATGTLTYGELGRLMDLDLAKDQRTKLRLAGLLEARGWRRAHGHGPRGFHPPGGLDL